MIFFRLKAACPCVYYRLCVCLCVNQGGTNHNRCTQRLVILHGIRIFPLELPRTFSRAFPREFPQTFPLNIPPVTSSDTSLPGYPLDNLSPTFPLKLPPVISPFHFGWLPAARHSQWAACFCLSIIKRPSTAAQ